jgi:hypothetical protein
MQTTICAALALSNNLAIERDRVQFWRIAGRLAPTLPRRSSGTEADDAFAIH